MEGEFQQTRRKNQMFLDGRGDLLDPSGGSGKQVRLHRPHDGTPGTSWGTLPVNVLPGTGARRQVFGKLLERDDPFPRSRTASARGGAFGKGPEAVDLDRYVVVMAFKTPGSRAARQPHVIYH
jgi:hypothetical protein